MKNEMIYKVSVVIPIYNVEEYLMDCLNSLAKQSYHNLEIILIDDGSLDNSGSICNDFMSNNDLNIIIRHNTNEGVSCARNEAIECSSGDYIVFVDSDDIVSPYYVENLLNALVSTKSEMVVCKYTNNLEEMKVSLDEQLELKTKILSQYEAFDQIIDNQYFGGYLWNKIFDNQIIKKYNIWFKNKISIWEDMEFVVQYLSVIKCVAVIEVKLYFYRHRENSALSTENLVKKHDKVIISKVMCGSQYQKYNTFFSRVNYMYFNALFDYVWNAKKSSVLSKSEIKMILSELKQNIYYKEISYKDKLKVFFMQL